MPSVMTHQLVGDMILKSLTNEEAKRIIHDNYQLYQIGCNGPDFLFFHNVYPTDILKSHDLNKLGTRMHTEHINEFYEVAYKQIMLQTNKEIKERMLAYFYGHITHWALDKSAHPYIIYWTGNVKEPITPNHHRMEGMIDEMLLREIRQTSVYDVPQSDVFHLDNDMLQAIARIYVPVAKEVFHKEIRVYDIRKAFDTWGKMIKLFNDPCGKKRKVLERIERLSGRPYLLSSHLLVNTLDEEHDILNRQQRTWCYPCDNTRVSRATFYDLMEDSRRVSVKIIDDIQSKLNSRIDDMGEYFHSENYLTGMTNEGPKKEMRYFSNIYEK